MSYLVLDAIFLTVVAALAIVAARRVRWAAVGLAVAVLLIATAVFDNVMIAIGLVAYDATRISGAFVGIAPIEDFAYPIAAAVGLPSLWVLLGGRRRD